MQRWLASSSDTMHRLSRHATRTAQHGAVFNPCHAFAVEIRFLVAAGRAVDEWVRTLRQKAKVAGMSMCQVCQ